RSTRKWRNAGGLRMAPDLRRVEAGPAIDVDPRLVALGLTGAPSAGPTNAPDTASGPTTSPSGAADLASLSVPLDARVVGRIRDAVARRHDDAVRLLSDLVRIPSVTPNYPGQDFHALVGGESRCAERLATVYDA